MNMLVADRHAIQARVVHARRLLETDPGEWSAGDLGRALGCAPKRAVEVAEMLVDVGLAKRRIDDRGRWRFSAAEGTELDAFDSDDGAWLPSAAEIERACEEIRREWSGGMECQRRSHFGSALLKLRRIGA